MDIAVGGGLKVMTVGGGRIVIIPVPCTNVGPIGEVTGRAQQAGTSVKRTPPQGEEVTEENRRMGDF